MLEAGASSEGARPVFIYDFVDVECPLGAAEQWCDDDGQRLSPFASEAGRDAQALLVRIGPSWAAGRIAPEVRVSLGACRRRGESLVVSIRWRAAQLPSLFPVLEGDIEFAPLGPGECRVILSASYVPPLGGAGLRLDRAVLHRVAESTARSFLSRLAESLKDWPPD